MDEPRAYTTQMTHDPMELNYSKATKITGPILSLKECP